MKKGIGLKDLAEMLDTSVSTVSRALRDAPDISSDTKTRVLQVAKRLNFKTNRNAAALASGYTKNIGVLIPMITNYYYATVLSGIQDEAYRLGFNVTLFVTNDIADREFTVLHEIDINSLDGLLISISSQTRGTTHFEEVIDRGLPIVFFDRIPTGLSCSQVVQDDFLGALTATRYLIDQGYRNIAHIGGPASLFFSKERRRGYLAALNESGLPVDAEMIRHSDFTLQSGYKDTQELLSLACVPDAIFAVNDAKAIGAIQALKNAGKRVGKDVGVIGFTNDPISTIIEPKLTTVEEPAYEIGQESCKLLIKHIKNKDFESRQIIMPGLLIERESALARNG